VIDPLQWLPLLYALTAPVLVWLLVLGRRSPRRATRFVALAAALALLVDLAILAVAIWALQPIDSNTSLWSLVNFAGYGAPILAGVFGTAAWVLLLADAVGGAGGAGGAGDGGDRRRLILLALVYALALLIGIGLPLRDPLLAPLRTAIVQLGGAGALLQAALQNSAAIAAIVIAFAFPASAPSLSPPSTPGASQPLPSVAP
jgi:hypothetical protein